MSDDEKRLCLAFWDNGQERSFTLHATPQEASDMLVRIAHENGLECSNRKEMLDLQNNDRDGHQGYSEVVEFDMPAKAPIGDLRQVLYLACFSDGSNEILSAHASWKEAEGRLVQVAQDHNIACRFYQDLLRYQQSMESGRGEWRTCIRCVTFPAALQTSMSNNRQTAWPFVSGRMWLSLFKGEDTSITIHAKENEAAEATLQKAANEGVRALTLDALISKLQDSDPFDGTWDAQVLPIDVPGLVALDTELADHIVDPGELFHLVQILASALDMKIFNVQNAEELTQLKPLLDNLMYTASKLLVDFTELNDHFEQKSCRIRSNELVGPMKKITEDLCANH